MRERVLNKDIALVGHYEIVDAVMLTKAWVTL
jgi:hypothetical protein